MRPYKPTPHCPVSLDPTRAYPSPTTPNDSQTVVPQCKPTINIPSESSFRVLWQRNSLRWQSDLWKVIFLDTISLHLSTTTHNNTPSSYINTQSKIKLDKLIQLLISRRKYRVSTGLIHLWLLINSIQNWYSHNYEKSFIWNCCSISFI